MHNGNLFVILSKSFYVVTGHPGLLLILKHMASVMLGKMTFGCDLNNPINVTILDMVSRYSYLSRFN